MSSEKNDTKELSGGWVLCSSKSTPGRNYYFNKKTGESSWTDPKVANKTDNQKKSQKEKTNKQEKKKEELQKRGVKRKSDGHNDEIASKRKHKQDKTTPEKCRLATIKKQSSDKNKYTKNLANTRLAQLRAQLHIEAQKEEAAAKEKMPEKSNKRKMTNTQMEKQAKMSRNDLKSPSFNDSKCSTTQSPSNESLTSIPSPSQFFAANKIISSMKAQLPEEFCDKIKQKDTYADIEQGICNQMPEYPSMKHPATPPQFSEASKLMSAIKSKLSYKASANKDDAVKTFNSAKDRMASLRTKLSRDSIETKDVAENSLQSNNSELSFSEEAMDVEECKEIIQNPPVVNTSVQCTKTNVGIIKENVVLVVDTNIFIHELDVIKNVLNSHIKGYSEQPTLLVPWRVINELDRLKDNNNGNGAICKRAKAAMDYLYKSLPENSRIKGQSLRDANSHIYPCELPDDEILNCSLQQAERGKSVILLSNDKNLCNKAMINGVRCIGLKELKSLLETKVQPSADPDLYASFKHYENTMYQLLANILESEMRAKYNNLWQHVLFKAPPWTLSDVVQCLLKHWIALFNEVFPRIEHLFTDLKNVLASIESKDSKSLSQAEVTNFKELCLDIAQKCQIIPEYMELAKVTVDRLVRKCAPETGDKCEKDGEMGVIDAFEGLWTVYSSYCGKLCTCLGVAHALEERLPGDAALDALTPKWAAFSAQIYALTHAIKGALSVENQLDLRMEEHVARLEAAFKESLHSISVDNHVVTKENLRIFCVKCRNMLQEAYTKFSQLTELLDECKNKMET